MKKRLGFISALIAGIAFASSIMSEPAQAITGASFSNGRIIDDFVFNNSKAMTPATIQAFLQNKVPNCDNNGNQVFVGYYNSSTARYPGAHTYTLAENIKRRDLDTRYPPPYTCLSQYQENSSVSGSGVLGSAGNNYGSPSSTPAGCAVDTNGLSLCSAAYIIYNAGVQYSINPQVLLVLLQKEQAIVTDDWPWYNEYRSATGYGCPDTAACDSAYYGFYNQVRNAARQFRLYANNPNNYNYTVGVNSIRYSPTAGCGTLNVNILNQATASLYNYTPYVPNQAALNNLYGTGDGCSAYGNRNFWRYFNDWFGTTYANDTTQPHPDGTFVSMLNRVYVISGGTRRLVTTGSVFASYRWNWNAVKPATTGDLNLPDGIPYDTFAPGALFRSPSSSVYIMAWDGASSTWKKQLVTYTGFNSLGYNWNDILLVGEGEIPTATLATPLDGSIHPQGTFITTPSDGRVWMIENNTRRYVSYAEILYSYNATWKDIKAATAGDIAMPVGADLPYREGILFYDGSNLYVADTPPSGPGIKRPIGPWECFADIFRYSMTDSYLFNLPSYKLPPATGSKVGC